MFRTVLGANPTFASTVRNAKRTRSPMASQDSSPTTLKPAHMTHLSLNIHVHTSLAILGLPSRNVELELGNLIGAPFGRIDSLSRLETL